MQNIIELEKKEQQLRALIDDNIKKSSFKTIEQVGEDPIGKGTYNSVFKAEHKSSENEITQIPPLVLSFNHYNDKETLEIAEYAEDLMNKVPPSPFIHFNLGKTEGVKISEKADNDLFKYLRENQFSTGELREILGQIILGLEHLHLLKIIHGDFKAANILVFLRQITSIDKETTKPLAHVKISDFDTLRKVDAQGKLLWEKAIPQCTIAVSSDQSQKITMAYYRMYDLVLLPVEEEPKITLQNIKDFVDEHKQLMGKTILIKQKNSFILYCEFKPGQWELIDKLNQNAFNKLEVNACKILEHHEISDEAKKEIASKIRDTLNHSAKQAIPQYQALNQFLEELFTLGYLINEISSRAQNPEDAAQLKPLINQLVEQDPNQRLAEVKMAEKYKGDPDQYIKSIYDWIKSDKFFGETPQNRERFFKQLFIKFRALDSSFKTSALMAQSKQDKSDSKLAEFDSINSIREEKSKEEKLKQFITSKSEIVSLIKDTSFFSELSLKNNNYFQSDIVYPVLLAWEKAKNKYDFMMSILKKPSEYQVNEKKENNNQIRLLMEIEENFDKSKQDLIKEIEDLKSKRNDVYKNYEKPLTQIMEWTNCAQKLKNHYAAALLLPKKSPPPIPERSAQKKFRK